MNSTKLKVGIGHLGAGHSAIGIAVSGEAAYAGFQAWSARPTTGAKSVLGGLVMTDAPVTKPQLVSASERCP